jgi:UDP-glucuronate 4-epimerase
VHVLITGSAGFLGFHISKKLLQNGAHVTLVDRFSDYYTPELKKLRANELFDSFGVKTLTIDLSNKSEIAPLYNHKYTHIVHLAGQPGVRVTRDNQLTYLNDNLTGFTNVMDLVVRLGVQNFFYASSSSIYQKAQVLPFDETEELEVPSNFYAKSKYLNEKIAESFFESVQNICGLRFFSVYGPWGRPDMAYFKLFQSAYSGEEFSLNGNGSISRDFTFVEDVSDALFDLISSGVSTPKVLNLGGGNVHAMRELISIIQEITGRQIKIVEKPSNKQDMPETRASTFQQDLLFGKTPRTSLYDGLSSMNSWINTAGYREVFLNWH